MEVEQTEEGRRLHPVRKSARTKKRAGRGWCLQAAPIGVLSRSEGVARGGAWPRQGAWPWEMGCPYSGAV